MAVVRAGTAKKLVSRLSLHAFLKHSWMVSVNCQFKRATLVGFVSLLQNDALIMVTNLIIQGVSVNKGNKITLNY